MSGEQLAAKAGKRARAKAKKIAKEKAKMLAKAEEARKRKERRKAHETKSSRDVALSAKKKVVKGVHSIHRKKIRTTVHFRRPRTLKLPRRPRYLRKAVPSRAKLDECSILRHPVTTEAGMKAIECKNTLIFIVDIRANKAQIKDAFRKMYGVEVEKVNTHIMPSHLKKASIKLHPDFEAMCVANKLGFL